MSKKWIFGSLALALLLGIAYLLGFQPSKCADAACSPVLVDLPPYGQTGPHAVGYQHLIPEEGVPEMLIWYPAVENKEEGKSQPYRFEVKIGAPLGTINIANSESEAIQDSAYDTAQAPYPLVILSPGFALGASSYGWLAEHIASYGFVVVAPEHNEKLDPQNDLWRSAVTRPQEMQTTLAYIEAATEPGGILEGLVDPETSAVVGHSYGGYTSLVAGGAQIHSESFLEYCQEARATAEEGAWLCDMLEPNFDSMAELAGFEELPEGSWPDWSIEGTDAVVALAGDAYFFGQPGLSGLDLPVLAIGGTADKDTPFFWGPDPTFRHSTGPRKTLVALEEAEHMIFTNTCDSVRRLARPLTGEFCSDSVWNRDEAHSITKHYVAAFLLAELAQDAEAAAALSGDALDWPKVSVESQGY